MDDSDFSDEFLLIEGLQADPLGSPSGGGGAMSAFDEDAYLRAFPDVALAVKSGERKSALDHYIQCGKREGRLSDLGYINALAGNDTSHFPACGLDALFLSRSGQCLVIGWLNEEPGAAVQIFVMVGDAVVAATQAVARCRRVDAEAAVSPPPGKLLGFWALAQIQTPVAPGAAMSISLVAGLERRTLPALVQHLTEDRLREVALEYMCSARYFANPQVEAHMQLENGVGTRLIEMNVAISRQVIGAAYSMQFGPRRATFAGSIVVCLYGRAEYLFLQAAFFSEAPGYEAYEFVYVSNSPELAEQLVKEATLAARIYGVSITLVILPGNAGFGAANNAAVGLAQSSRVLIVNPDVFPRDRNWALQHSAVIADRPADQTALFGVPLYYDDGSLMHAGMFLESDLGLSVRNNGIEQRSMLRVEHYGKGAPPNMAGFLAARPVPAVTGAFMSIDRDWFEALGGFSLEYVFGHYEDADLCLKSLNAGKPVWLHNVPFWHLEGKGSVRRPVHDGGSTVNRWYFTERWAGFVEDGLRGPAPARLRAPSGKHAA